MISAGEPSCNPISCQAIILQKRKNKRGDTHGRFININNKTAFPQANQGNDKKDCCEHV
jgi:hypothetical protein